MNTRGNEVMSTQELERLMEKACHFQKNTNPSIRPLMQFYRNKNKSYWDDIRKNHNGKMHPYIRNDDGDLRSVINGRLEGLFFSAIPGLKNGGYPLGFSPFGDHRFTVPAYLWMEDEDINLYFADFYCNNDNPPGKWHYVTIVMAKEDHPISDELIELDKHENPFLKIKNGTVYAPTNVHVELVYTETINVPDYVNLHDCTLNFLASGRGGSKPNGVPKNQNCPHCHLDPIHDSTREAPLHMWRWRSEDDNTRLFSLLQIHDTPSKHVPCAQF